MDKVGRCPPKGKAENEKGRRLRCGPFQII